MNITTLKSLAKKTLVTSFLLSSISAYASGSVTSTSNQRDEFHHFYLGGLLGWGCTTWDQLVATDIPVRFAAPIKTKDTGPVWGFYGGYEFIRHLAIQVGYARFPETKLNFDPDYNFYLPLTQMTSKTESYSILMKFIVPLGHGRISNRFSMYASAGVSFTHRKDALLNDSHAGPRFGAGFNYDINSRWTTELGFQYYAGYDTPIQDFARKYIPFLYSLEGRLAFRFG